jgi:hypothetical protein
MKTLNGIDAFPIFWPAGWARHSATGSRKNSRYEVSFGTARNDVLKSLRLLGSSEVVISSNVPVRHDGLPYATYTEPTDPGCCVYWVRKGKPQVMACDQWRTVRENLRAIGLALEGLRALERSGASQIFERAFTGFAALPAETKRPWRVVLEMDVAFTNGSRDSLENAKVREVVETRYRKLAKVRHPDMGGSHEAMLELNAAKTEAYKELGL